ncbi:MAG: hypothetical protein PW734_12230 [Verrucomicrobium sp.]|nr:hypothetical protein [Verrucomicrobium sp.]
MSAAADSFQEVVPGLRHWAAYEPKVKTDLCCAACLTPDGWVLIDPIPLAEEAFAGEKAAAIFLTNGNHARHADAWRKKLSVPIWAPAEAEDLEVVPDHAFAGEPVHGILPISIPGATRGETAFLTPQGWLLMGDAVINVGSDGPELLPKKYCWNEAEARASLKNLLDHHEFTLVTFAHGTPLRTRAKERLRALL